MFTRVRTHMMRHTLERRSPTARKSRMSYWLCKVRFTIYGWFAHTNIGVRAMTLTNKTAIKPSNSGTFTRPGMMFDKR